MLLKSLHLRNVRSYVDQKINFPSGSTLLAGDIGVGKSTILLGLDFAFFGTRRGGISGSEILRYGADSCSVELCFELDGNDFSIKRILKRSKKNISQEAGYMTINGMMKQYTPMELTAKMLEYLGYPMESLKKHTPIFRYTVYMPQEEMKHIVLSDDRLNILRKIFNTDKYGKVRENTSLLLTEIRAMKREIEASTSDIDKLEKSREEKTNEGNVLKLETEKQENKISEINTSIDYIRQEMKNTEEKIKKYDEIKNCIARIETDIENYRRIMNKMNSDISKVENDIEKKNKVLDDYSKLKKPEMEESKLEEILANTESSINENNSERAVLLNEINKLTVIFKEGKCGFCGQPIHNPEAFRENIETKKKLAEECNKKIQTLMKERIRYKTMKTSMNSYKIFLERKGQTEKFLDELVKRKEILNGEKQDNRNTAQNLEIRLQVLLVHEQEHRKFKDMYSTLEKKLYTTMNEKVRNEREFSRMKQRIEDIEKEVTRLNKEILEKKESRKKLTNLSELSNWLETFFMPLMESMERHVMIAIQKEFNSYFQSWFDIVMGDSLNVRLDENFSPVIEQNGYETEYQNLSGGEKTSVALAYRLALNRVINEMIETIKTKDVLILDEPTDGFSTDQLDRMRDVLNALNLNQILIVSHEPKIDTFVNNVIKVYKDDHVSRIVY